MRSILILTCCLALASVAAADQNKHKNKPASQVQQQQQVIKPGNHAGRTGLQTTTGIQGHQLQTNSQLRMQHKALKTQSANLPGSQSNKTFTKNVTKNNTHVTNANVKNFNVPKNFTNKYQTVKFQQGNHIPGSQNWQGKQYIVFKNYQSEWHDRDWWHDHHSRIVLIGGGWYYWDTGWWYPAWGYEPRATFVYDGPIYAYHDMDPGQVVANVQSALQQQGYYEGEVDGLLGPLTRAALARYQADHGLYETAAIDEPTMEALGFA